MSCLAFVTAPAWSGSAARDRNSYHVIARLLAGLVAIALLLSSGVGSLGYRCAMISGGLARTCCCSKTNQTPRALDDGRRAERPVCCKTRLDGAASSATFDTRSHFSEGVPTLATLAVALELDFPTSRDVVLPSRARGPPPSGGPPLYIEYKSLLS